MSSFSLITATQEGFWVMTSWPLISKFYNFQPGNYGSYWVSCQQGVWGTQHPLTIWTGVRFVSCSQPHSPVLITQSPPQQKTSTLQSLQKHFYHWLANQVLWPNPGLPAHLLTRQPLISPLHLCLAIVTKNMASLSGALPWEKAFANSHFLTYKLFSFHLFSVYSQLQAICNLSGTCHENSKVLTLKLLGCSPTLRTGRDEVSHLLWNGLFPQTTH